MRPANGPTTPAWRSVLADSLIASDGTLDPADLMQRFVRWRDHGDNVVHGRACFDIGNTVRAALDRFARDGEPLAGPTAPRSAGNGSLMRLAPVPDPLWPRPAAAARDRGAAQSRTTHGAREAVQACVLFAELVAEAIAGGAAFRSAAAAR
ncbi:MAG: ADP-ribosylglycohydrolase family protein [Rhodopseudomonas palustris]|nr:ADP-ribosylglycohydrolase family protein [Rhodopseudomonas palustris]